MEEEALGRSSPGPTAASGISSRRRPFLRSFTTGPSLPGKNRRYGRAHAELGLGQARSLQCPLRGPYRVDPQRVDLHLDRRKGDRPHCARNTRTWQSPFGKSCHGIPLHAGDGPVLSPLPKGEPQAEGAHGARSGSLREVPPCPGGGHGGQGPERRAGGHMV